MRHVLGFTPHYTAEEALREFAGRKHLEPSRSESPGLTYDEERLRDTIDRRRRARVPEASPAERPDGAEPEVITEDVGEEVV